MDLKPVIVILLCLGFFLVGCADEDACKPRNIAFCLDEHRIWKCVPDGNPEKGSPSYIIEVVDCRISTQGRTPYCVTNLWEDGSRGSTHCRTEPMRYSNNTEDAGDATSHDIESDED